MSHHFNTGRDGASISSRNIKAMTSFSSFSNILKMLIVYDHYWIYLPNGCQAESTVQEGDDST